MGEGKRNYCDEVCGHRGLVICFRGKIKFFQFGVEVCRIDGPVKSDSG